VYGDSWFEANKKYAEYFRVLLTGVTVPDDSPDPITITSDLVGNVDYVEKNLIRTIAELMRRPVTNDHPAAVEHFINTTGIRFPCITIIREADPDKEIELSNPEVPDERLVGKTLLHELSKIHVVINEPDKKTTNVLQVACDFFTKSTTPDNLPKLFKPMNICATGVYFITRAKNIIEARASDSDCERKLTSLYEAIMKMTPITAARIFALSKGAVIPEHPAWKGYLVDLTAILDKISKDFNNDPLRADKLDKVRAILKNGSDIAQKSTDNIFYGKSNCLFRKILQSWDVHPSDLDQGLETLTQVTKLMTACSEACPHPTKLKLDSLNNEEQMFVIKGTHTSRMAFLQALTIGLPFIQQVDVVDINNEAVSDLADVLKDLEAAVAAKKGGRPLTAANSWAEPWSDHCPEVQPFTLTAKARMQACIAETARAKLPFDKHAIVLQQIRDKTRVSDLTFPEGSDFSWFTPSLLEYFKDMSLYCHVFHDQLHDSHTEINFVPDGTGSLPLALVCASPALLSSMSDVTSFIKAKIDPSKSCDNICASIELVKLIESRLEYYSTLKCDPPKATASPSSAAASTTTPPAATPPPANAGPAAAPSTTPTLEAPSPVAGPAPPTAAEPAAPATPTAVPKSNQQHATTAPADAATATGLTTPEKPSAAPELSEHDVFVNMNRETADAVAYYRELLLGLADNHVGGTYILLQRRGTE
jgi:hypothetical protein